MKRKLSPLVQAITLYNSLDDRDKVTLSEYIKSQTTRPKSTTVVSAGKRSPRSKSGDSSAANTETETVAATTAAVCAECGQGEHYYVHSPDNPVHHKFSATIKTKGASV